MIFNEQSIAISIIVPVYNIENYIEKCLDSILIQDMQNIEIIAVNDGSTDSSGSILEKYAKKDSRIQIINLKNGGLGWARNHGLMRAKGQYLLFIDGDDFIADGCLSKLYSYAILNNADIVIFTYKEYKNGFFGKKHNYSYYKNINMDSLTATKFMLLNNDGFACNKLCKCSIFIEGNLRFKEGMFYEDVPVTCAMLLKAQRIFYIDNPFYYYVQRDTSLTKSFRTAKKTYDVIYSSDLVKEEIIKAGLENELAEAFNYDYIVKLIWALVLCYWPKKYKSKNERLAAKAIIKKRFSEISIRQVIFGGYLKLILCKCINKIKKSFLWEVKLFRQNFSAHRSKG